MTTALVVDPQPVVRRGVCSLLREQFHGVTAIEAATSAEALGALRRQAVALLILELDLPGTDGLRLIREIRATSPRTTLLVFTGLGCDDLGPRALHAGAAAVVRKEAPLSDLAASISRQLAGGLHAEEFNRTADRPSLSQRGAQPGDVLADAHPRLSDREIEVLRLLAQGYSAPRVGQLLCISKKTVNTHRSHIYDKLGVSDISHLTAYAFRHGLLRNRRALSEPWLEPSQSYAD